MTEAGSKIVITNAKVDVKNIVGRNNFGLWKSDMRDALYMLDLDQLLKETRLDDTRESEWERLNIKCDAPKPGVSVDYPSTHGKSIRLVSRDPYLSKNGLLGP